jgi:hypothetical protein
MKWEEMCGGIACRVSHGRTRASKQLLRWRLLELDQMRDGSGMTRGWVVRFVGGCAVVMMRDGLLAWVFVFLSQSFGRCPATSQAEAALQYESSSL